MAIFKTLGDLAANLGGLVQARIELASVEMGEHVQRYLRYFLLSLTAMFLLWMSIALCALLVVILFWDTHRIEAVMGLAGAFALSGVLVGMKLRSSFAARPSPLATTLAELRKDVEAMRQTGHADG